ncbi:MAG: ATP-binding protein [Actinomycetota bacterium]
MARRFPFSARRRLGLRARIIAAFTLGALVLSVLLAGTTFALTRENLVRQRERSALTQVYVNARISRDTLRVRETDPDRQSLLNSLLTQSSRPVLYDQGDWVVQSIEFGRDAIPVALRRRVIDGVPARMRYHLQGQPYLAVGIPIPAVDAAYFEVVSLEELDDSLESIGVSLLGAALLTSLAGAGLGIWASRRVLRPLADVGHAAQAIAGGRLDTRLEAIDDPDLAALAGSFNDMARALQERIERDARFASDVSHELRSPLTTLSAAIEVLQGRRDEMPERAQAALDLLVADVARFSALVEDLLEISRFDAGAARLDLEEVRFGELVLQAIGVSTDDDFPVELDAELDTVPVQVDKRRLVRVVANLIDNARSHGGGVSLVALRRVPTGVELAVEDNGAGVPLEERDLIFERFSRGASGAGRRGTGDGVGLGLALVREHIRLHGGDVWVEDRPDGQPGARFVVWLPAAEKPAAPELEPVAP